MSRGSSSGGTGPLAAPYSTIKPRRRSAFRLSSKVAFPTPSYTGVGAAGHVADHSEVVVVAGDMLRPGVPGEARFPPAGGGRDHDPAAQPHDLGEQVSDTPGG